MKKPEKYEIKKWIHDNVTIGLKVHYYQTGADATDTDWEMIPERGKSKRVKAATVSGLVDVCPDWHTVLRLLSQYRNEVKEWEKYAKKEAADLAEYERLKKKFSN